MRNVPGRVLPLAVLSCALLLGRSARCEEPVAAPPMETHWYGGRVLLSDGLSLGLLVVGAATSPDLDKGPAGASPLFFIGAAGWYLGAPIVHAHHAGLIRGAASFMLRVALPLIGLGIGWSSAQGCWQGPGSNDACDNVAAIDGFILGTVVAEIADVAWVARDHHAVERPALPPPRSPPSPDVQLALAPRAGGAVLGLSGSF